MFLPTGQYLSVGECIGCYERWRQLNPTWTVQKFFYGWQGSSVDMKVIVVIHKAERKRQHVRIDMAIRMRSPIKRLLIVDHNPPPNQKLNQSLKENDRFLSSLNLGIYIF